MPVCDAVILQFRVTKNWRNRCNRCLQNRFRNYCCSQCGRYLRKHNCCRRRNRSGGRSTGADEKQKDKEVRYWLYMKFHVSAKRMLSLTTLPDTCARGK